MASIAQLIRHYARQYGVDPRAALAVASVEGGLRAGAVGDQGTSYGPFQLHRGGAMPRGKNAAWASSPAGIQYAIQRMAASGARGLQGQAAVNAIVRNFERPAAPDAEVAKAMGRYGGGFTASGPAAPVRTLQGAVAGGSGDNRAGVLQALIQAAGQKNPDYQPLYAALHQAGAAATPDAPAAAAAPSSSPAAAARRGTISELFYDPLGAIKNGQQIPAIGGHEDHVHFSSQNARAMLAAIRQAQAFGLHVGENPYVGGVNPVHVKGSYHYRDFPGRYHGRKLGEAIDVSGNPRAMAHFYRWVSNHL